MNKSSWIEALGKPSYDFSYSGMKFVKRYEYPGIAVEMYLQPNGPETVHRVLVAIAEDAKKPCPAVVVPYYYPEAMLGFDPETGEKEGFNKDKAIMEHLVRRGYIAISAQSYHLTYIDSDLDINDFSRWTVAAEKLKKDNPGWSGVGKLVSDTRLLIDALCDDERVDSQRIGIIGHSLGGKMAFYTGCLDERIKAIVASDFGIGWEQTNWKDIWYWGEYVDELKLKGMEHSQLLGIESKPFCLIAGEADNDDSWDMMNRAQGYKENDGKLKIINHATGHNPPRYTLEEAYDFLDKWL